MTETDIWDDDNIAIDADDDADMFGGDWVTEVPDSIKEKVPFVFKLVEFKKMEGTNENDPGRKSVNLAWELVDSGNPEHDVYVGMPVQPIWLNYWPGLTKTDFDNFSPETRKMWTMSRNQLQIILRALGCSEEEVARPKISMLNDRVGYLVKCMVYRDKRNQVDRLDIKMMVPAED